MSVRNVPLTDSFPWKSSDPLGELLHFLHLDGVFYTQSAFSSPWGLALPALPECLMFHVVTSGRCWLHVEGESMRELTVGDFVLLPHGEGHQLLSNPQQSATPLFDTKREQISPRYERLRFGGGYDPQTTMVCGAVSFKHPVAKKLVMMLPKLLCIDVANTANMEWFQSMLGFMASEVEAMQPGGETIVTRLSDILVVQALRYWLSENPLGQRGWLYALQDNKVGAAIIAIQRKPDFDWTVERLAQEVAMSRSAFAARFKRLVGEPPMQFLAEWRMQIAVGWLSEERLSIAQLADRLGYKSEAAFSRAFKRFNGCSPSEIKRRSSS